MKRYILITLVDGTQYERDLPQTTGIPIGSPAIAYHQFAQAIATQGFIEDPKADVPKWIAPSQVKTAQIIFEPSAS